MKRLMASEWLPLLVLMLCLVLTAPAWAQGGAPGAGNPFSLFLAWLNGPMVKTGALLLGGFALRQWPQVVNKAIPVLLAACSAVVSVVHLIFPEQALAPTAALMPAAYFSAAVAHGGGWGSFFSGILVPVVLAVGVNSGQKNVAEWARLGAGVWDATGRSGKRL